MAKWADWEIRPSAGKWVYLVGISQVELSKGNSVCIMFGLERLINRKLHYRRCVVGYNVLRVKSVLPMESVYLFKISLELDQP